MRSSAMPTSAATPERDRHRGERGTSRSTPAVRAKEVLHDVGRVGADHDQLAVRHVDDAHQAVGDREARARRAAGSSRATRRRTRGPAHSPAREARLRRRAGSSAPRGGCLRPASRRSLSSSSSVLRARIAPSRRACGSRRCALPWSPPSAPALAAISSSSALDLRRRSPSRAPSDQRQHRRVGAAGSCLRRGEAHVAIGRAELAARRARPRPRRAGGC